MEKKRWLYAVIGVIILLVARSSFKKKASAYGYSISDYVQEYGEIKQHISDLKKADAPIMDTPAK